MLINIGDEKAGKRTLTVTNGDEELFKATVNDVAAAHKLAKIGLHHGWDSDELKKAVKK